MKQSKTQDHYTTYEREGRVVLTLNEEIMIPEDAPVRLTSAQLGELDYRELYRAYSSKGRKSAANPRVMFKVMVYRYQRSFINRPVYGAIEFAPSTSRL